MPCVTCDDNQRVESALVPVDPVSFRNVLGAFATGVAVITADGNSGPVGLTVQSFASLSLDPPLVLFCPSATSSTWRTIERAEHFAANVLAEDQDLVGRRFATPGIDRFSGIDWTPGPSGAPLLSGVLAHIDCTIESVHDGGDHLMVVGRVLHLYAESDLRPLVYFRGEFGRLGGTPAMTMS